MNRNIVYAGIIFFLISIALIGENMLYAGKFQKSQIMASEIEKKNNQKLFFKDTHFIGVKNENLTIVFSSETEIDSVELKMSLDSVILLEKLPKDTNLLETDKKNHWTIKSNKKQKEFELALRFKEEGLYKVTIGTEELSIKIFDTLEDKIFSGVTDSKGTEINVDSEVQKNQEATGNLINNNKIMDNNVVERPSELVSRITTNVSNWDQFQDALNNSNVTNINITNDISGNSSLNSIDRDLSINGNGYVINTQLQQFIVTGANRTLTVRNATLSNELGIDTPHFRTASGTLNTTFIFSNILVHSDNRFVGRSGSTGNEDPNIEVIFDGGTNIFRSVSNSNSQPLTVVRHIVLNNNAVVESNNRPFSSTLIGDTPSVAKIDAYIEEESELKINLISGVGLVVTGLSVNGVLEIKTTGAAIVTQGSMDYLHFGESSKSVLNQEGEAGFVFASNSEKLRIDIDLGASFDFINTPGKPILFSTTPDLITIIEAENLAVWRVGRKDVGIIKPSQNFTNLWAEMLGPNASEIKNTNNNVFRSTYSTQGLVGYSRISTDGIATKTPVDPLNPEEEINPDDRPLIPENQGDLRIDFISQFRFGTQSISGEDKTYYASEQPLIGMTNNNINSEVRPNYVQITDNRSSEDGWQLSVTQREQLKTVDGKELFGATIGFSNQVVLASHDGQGPKIIEKDAVLTPGNSTILLVSQGNSGKGTWIYRFGDIDNANRSIFLNVPKEATPEATTYKTELNWELNAIPENEN